MASDRVRRFPWVMVSFGALVIGGLILITVNPGAGNPPPEQSDDPNRHVFGEEGPIQEDPHDFDPLEADRQDMVTTDELTIGVRDIPVGFNLAANSGHSTAALEVSFPMQHGGAWIFDLDQEPMLNTDYVLSVEESQAEDGAQVLHYELNQDAVWNDGTAIDAATYQHTVQMHQEYAGELVDRDVYAQVGEFQPGEDEWSFSLRMDETVEDPTELFSRYSVIHPDLDTPEALEAQLVTEPDSDYMTGPFILDEFNIPLGRSVLDANPDWWAEEPLIERLTYDAQSVRSVPSAYGAEEIDVVGPSLVSMRLAEVVPDNLANYHHRNPAATYWPDVGFTNDDASSPE